eukprot:5697700-Amphidinium_carterae.1
MQHVAHCPPLRAKLFNSCNMVVALLWLLAYFSDIWSGSNCSQWSNLESAADCGFGCGPPP